MRDERNDDAKPVTAGIARRDALKAMERTEHGVLFLKMPYFISSSKEKRLEVEAFEGV